MSSLQIGRLLVGPPLTFTEQTGDPVTTLGGAPVPGSRTAPQYQIGIGTYAADGQTDTLGARLTIRRQLRSLLNNSAMKFQGYIYLVYSDDPENSGWYIPDQSPLTDFAASAGLATGLWQLATQNWYVYGKHRTHREARQVWMKDLRTGLYPRDQRGWILATDFSALPALQLTVLPNGASSVMQAVSGQVLSGPPLPTGRDGGACQVIQGLADLAVVSYERPESSLNLSDVIAYDRMGQITAPSTGPDTSWVELYGPDWPWNWQTSGQPNDTPVLDNGLVRVRYDASAGDPGLRVDVWNGSAYVEQGKMLAYRVGDVNGFCNTWVSAQLMEWTPDRAVMEVVLSNSADGYSRECVYVTVQRGEIGVTFELYPALKSTGAQADGALHWTPALNSGTADLNESIAKIDSQGSGSWTPGAAGAAKYAATAGTGAGTGHSGEYGSSFTTLGNANFTTSENWVAILRCPTAYNTIGAYQTTLSVLQAANCQADYVGSDSNAYGTATDAYRILSQNAAGYVQAQVAFSATQAQQVLEAESMTLGTGTSTTTDAAASGTGNNTTTATRTTDANAHATQATWPNSFVGVFRVFARVKVSAGTGSFYAKTGATTGATVTTTSTSYVWLDLGEITSSASTLEIHGWFSTGSGTLSVDRVEAILTQDRTRTSAIFSGARDQSESALLDSRVLGSVVTRG